MKLLKRFLIVLTVSGCALTSFSQQVPDETDKLITAALASGNATGLSNFFNSMIDLGITGNEDSYSKTQATRILQEFFSKNPVKSYKVTKQGNSNDGSHFSIGALDAGNKNFRVYYLLKKVDGHFLIQQLQIQAEK